MANKNPVKTRKISLIAFAVPVGLLVASAFFPLRPLLQQAMIGILLVWFYVTIFMFSGL